MESAGEEQRRAVRQALETLSSLGASVREVALENIALVAGASTAVIGAEAYAYHRPWIRKRAEEYGPDVRERLRLGAFVSGADYVDGQRARALVRDEVDAVLAGLDVLIAPTTPIAATVVGRERDRRQRGPQPVRPSLIRFTRPFNITGHPAASIPCGFTARRAANRAADRRDGRSTRRPCSVSRTRISARRTGILAAHRSAAEPRVLAKGTGRAPTPWGSTACRPRLPTIGEDHRATRHAGTPYWMTRVDEVLATLPRAAGRPLGLGCPFTQRAS